MTVLSSRPGHCLTPQSKQVTLLLNLNASQPVRETSAQETSDLSWLPISSVIVGELLPLAASVSLSGKWERLGVILVVNPKHQER